MHKLPTLTLFLLAIVGIQSTLAAQAGLSPAS